MSEKPVIETVDDSQEHHERSIGSLRGEVWLTVQTYQAQSLVGLHSQPHLAPQ